MCDRKRSVNFTKKEILLLVDLILAHKDIIENKTTDAVTWKTKEKAWLKIENLFNSKSGLVARNVKTLKIKYEGIKKDLKKKLAQNKKQLYMTGGGPKTEIDLTEYEKKLMPVLSVAVEGLPARNDGDAIINISELQKTSSENVEDLMIENDLSSSVINTELEEYGEGVSHKGIINTSQKNIEANHVTNTVNNTIKTKQETWDKWDKNLLKKKKSSELNINNESGPSKINKNSATIIKFQNLAEEKIGLVGIQKDFLKDESKLKLLEIETRIELIRKQIDQISNEEKRKDEEHILKLMNMKEDQERKQKEHDLQIKILEAQLKLHDI